MSNDDRAARLAAIKAEREAIAAERAKREADKALEDELAKAEQDLVDDKAIAEAEEEHGPAWETSEQPGTQKLAILRTHMGAILLKRPSPVMYNRFVDLKAPTREDVLKLVRHSLVYPTERFDRILEEQPGLLAPCTDVVAVLAGIRAKVVSGK